MKTAAHPPVGGWRPRQLGVGYPLLCLLIACGAAAGTYALAATARAPHPHGQALAPAVARSSSPVESTPGSSRAGAAGSVAATTPSAAQFAVQFVEAANRYAAAHGDPARLAQADCVQASAGHYMCSYAMVRPGNPVECHVMQARWTPAAASTFTIDLAGRSLRCTSLRQALRSLR